MLRFFLLLLPVLLRAQSPPPVPTWTEEAVVIAMASRGCSSCHEASAGTHSRLEALAAPRLEQVGARLTPAAMRRFLREPHRVRPGTRMPDLLHALEPRARDEVVEDLVHFLAGRGEAGPLPTTHVDIAEMERGRQLYHEVGCVACHAPDAYDFELALPLWRQDEVDPDDRELRAEAVAPYVRPGTREPGRVPLGGLAGYSSLEALSSFLLDPLAVRPAGAMPSLGLSPHEARAIAAWLLHGRKGAVPEERPGLLRRYWEVKGLENLDGIAALPGARCDVSSDFSLPADHRKDHFAVSWSGLLEIPEEGEWVFSTRSDDGSMLWIDGRPVVDNDGIHPPRSREGRVRLEAGVVAIEVAMFEVGGGELLEVTWEGPGVARGPIPPELLHRRVWSLSAERPVFERDPARAERGERHYRTLGCVSCHEPERDRVSDAPALKRMRVGDLGCLAERPAGAVPAHDFAPGEREAIVALLESPERLEAPEAPAARIRRRFRQLRCDQCHRRDGLGGVHPLRKEYFRLIGDAEVGNEGRLPPELTGAGRKLTSAWLREVLVEGAVARGHVSVRMPKFGEANVEHFIEDFADADPQPPEQAVTSFSPALVEAGHRLVGTRGMGCIRCHTFDGRESLGVPAVDLMTMSRRLRAPWFRDLLLRPTEILEDSRMPEFWQDGDSPVPEILGGDARQQVDAIWAYLNLGRAMPMPEGLEVKPGEYELLPGDRPRMVGVFMKGVSPRTVLIGHRERVHFAFDVQNSRLAQVWRGPFFDAQGTWRGRAGQLEVPPSPDRLILPPGPMMARLADEGAPWPDGREASLRPRVLGRRLDEAGRPWFRYRVAGFEVEESFVPRVALEGAGFTRRLIWKRSSDRAEAGIVRLRLAAGERIKDQGGGRWLIEQEVPHGMLVEAPVVPRVRRGSRGDELLLPLDSLPQGSIEVHSWW